MLFLVRLLRIVVVLLVVRLLLRGIVTWMRARRAAATPPPRPDRDLVRDRICNTYLPRERALRSVVDGHEEYFCSPACRERARAGLDSGATAVQSQGLR